MICQVANAGTARSDALKFRLADSDEVTPTSIRDGGTVPLQQGELFEAYNLGLPELRHALARCSSTPISMDPISVTPGRVDALMLAVQAGVNAEDEVEVGVPVRSQPYSALGDHGGRIRHLPGL